MGGVIGGGIIAVGRGAVGGITVAAVAIPTLSAQRCPSSLTELLIENIAWSEQGTVRTAVER